MEGEINNYKTFFTGEELFNKVKTKDDKLGIATVYRFLKYLRDKGKLHSYICNRKILYSKEKSNHCHFICEKCNKVQHFNLKKIDFIKKELGNACHFQVDITGTCAQCLKKN